MEGENQPSQRTAIDWDTTLSTLAATRRRYLLAALADAGGTATVAELSRQVIAAEEEEGLGETVPDDQVTETVTVLRHSHVPKLLKEGLVEWTDDDHLRLTPAALSNPVLLPLARWSRYPSPVPIPTDATAQRERSQGD